MGIDLKKCPDYVKLAESYGAQGIRAQSLDELGKAVKVGLNSDVATVIDIPIDPEEDVFTICCTWDFIEGYDLYHHSECYVGNIINSS